MMGAPRSPGAPASRLKGARVAWAALLAYGAILFVLVGAAAGGSDASGYFNEARLLSHGKLHAPFRALAQLPVESAPPYLYVPLGMKPAPDGTPRLVPTYSPGLSLMLAGAAPIVGWGHAGDAVLLLHSLAGLSLVYALGRLLGLTRPWAFTCAAVLACSPLYLFMSLWAMSDVPAMAWVAAAVLASWKSRDRVSWALAAGACAGVAFLVRPTNFLVAAPMLLAIGLSPRRLALAAAGGIPGVLAWACINHAAYGAWLESGYGNLWVEFHTGLIAPTLAFCASQLPGVLCPLVVAAPGIFGFLATRTRAAAVLASWATLYIAFYAPYRWTHEEWWFLRFLLPAAPALLVAAFLVLQAGYVRMAAASAPAARVAAAVLLAGSVGVELGKIRPLHAWSIGHGEKKYGRVAEWLAAHAPDNAVILSKQFSGAGFYYTHYVLIRTDELTPQTVNKVRAAVRSEGRPVYAVVFPFEVQPILELPGVWTHVGSVEDVAILRSDWGDGSR